MHQEAPRHEAVLGRKVRLVIWDTTSRGKRKGGNNQKYLGKGEGEKEGSKRKERPAAGAAAFSKTTNLSSIHYSRGRAPRGLFQSTTTDSRSAGKFYFLSHPPTRLLNLFAYRTVTPQLGRPKGKNILGTEVEVSWQLQNDSCQLPQRRGRADVSDPVVRHPPERGTNPLLRTKRTHGQNGFARGLNRYIKKKKRN